MTITGKHFYKTDYIHLHCKKYSFYTRLGNYWYKECNRLVEEDELKCLPHINTNKKSSTGQLLKKYKNTEDLIGDINMNRVRNTISDYYRVAKLEPIKDIRHRFFKIQLLSGHWKTITVRSAHQLRRILIKEAPYYVGISTASFLYPEEITNKHYRTHVILDAEMWIDVDCNDFPSPKLTNGLDEIYKIAERFKDYKLAFSGGGFYLISSIEKPKTHNFKEKIEYYEAYRKKVVEELIRYNHNVDVILKDGEIESTPMIDYKRVRRLIGSLNVKRRRASFPLPNTKPRQRDFRRKTKIHPKIPMNLVTPRLNRPLFKKRTKAMSGKQAGTFFYFLNNINGYKDLFVPMLNFAKKYTIFQKLKLIEAQKTYRLGDLFVFYDKFGYYKALGLKPIRSARLIKIMRYLNCSNVGSQYKRKSCYWDIGCELADVLLSMTKTASKGHYEYLVNLGYNGKYERLIGNSNKLFQGQIE